MVVAYGRGFRLSAAGIISFIISPPQLTLYHHPNNTAWTFTTIDSTLLNDIIITTLFKVNVS